MKKLIKTTLSLTIAVILLVSLSAVTVSKAEAAARPAYKILLTKDNGVGSSASAVINNTTSYTIKITAEKGNKTTTYYVSPGKNVTVKFSILDKKNTTILVRGYTPNPSNKNDTKWYCNRSITTGTCKKCHATLYYDYK